MGRATPASVGGIAFSFPGPEALPAAGTGRESHGIVLGPEDLILHKLMAARDRDMADVAEILALTRELDVAYLRRWAPVLAVGDALEDRLKRAGLS